jgi:hypothetical protein
MKPEETPDKDLIAMKVLKLVMYCKENYKHE